MAIQTQEQRAARRLLDHIGPRPHITLRRVGDTMLGVVVEPNGAPNSKVQRFSLWTTRIQKGNGAEAAEPPPRAARWTTAKRAKQRKIMQNLWATRWAGRRKSEAKRPDKQI